MSICQMPYVYFCNYSINFNQVYPNMSAKVLGVRISDLNHLHKLWRHSGHICTSQHAHSKSHSLIPIFLKYKKKMKPLAPGNFYIQSFSLTECIVIVGVRKTGGCLCVCLSVCLCVCVSVRASKAKLLGWFQLNFQKMVPQWSSGVRLSFGSFA